MDVFGGFGAGFTATPTPMSPFIPPAACPGMLQRYSYLPVFVMLTVNDAVCPGCRVFVTLPTHVFFAAVFTGLKQNLKVWKPRPLFVTLKV